eukprot:359942_1
MAFKSTLLLLFSITFLSELTYCDPKICSVIGVSPKDCSKYDTSQQFFNCGGNENKKIPIKYVNDDYCDCIGSGDDEPGTSACNNGLFYCNNIGYRGKYVYSSLV